jgi:LCP family protein required for cell wall assembly
MYESWDGRGGAGAPPRRDDRVAPTQKRKLPWYYTVMVVVGSLLLVVSGGSLALLYGLSAKYDNQAGHQDIIDDSIRNTTKVPEGPLNFLVLGTDSRANEQAPSLDDAGDSRSDTILLVHVAKGLGSAFIVSIPRDSYVDIGPSANGKWKGGTTKINAAYSYGGAKLTAETVYNLTQVKLDGAVLIDFSGIENMVNAVGGINVCPLFTVGNWFKDYKQYGPDNVVINGVRYPGWKQGKCYDMGGTEAMVFARQREAVAAAGDFARMKDQQLVMKALAVKATSAGMLTDLGKLDALLTAAAKSLTLDKGMNLRDLAFALKGISPNEIKFATTPYKNAENLNGESVVRLDQAADQVLWQAIRDDKTDDWLAQHPQPDVPTWSGKNDPVTPSPTASTKAPS